jgi:formylglycine-generating enzyme required for sulfatase activity
LPLGDRAPDAHPEAAPVSAEPDISEVIGLTFVFIPPGRFLMGSHEDEPGRQNDEWQHEVVLTQGVYLQTALVTQRQWKAIMGNNPSCFPDVGSHRPVDGVSWEDCQEFINRLNARSRLRYRLPTEAEWEYACRAGSVTTFCNGDISQNHCELDPFLDEVAWYCGNSDFRSHPVRKKRANAWGLFDMHGNLCEWCLDCYGSYGALPQADPLAASAARERVCRGGSWISNVENCRSAARFAWPPHSRSDYIGFRLVRLPA